ncbi:MAG: hypothetical protein K6T59_18475 [Bryobacteraceae bacterium]|nr:hypothetical protein [Bryobacteraceae bacterium]
MGLGRLFAVLSVSAVLVAVVLLGQLAGQPAVFLPPEVRTVSLPPDVRVVPPSADIHKEVASFSGWWAGIWDRVLPTVLVVEEITPERLTEPAGALVVYAWGDAPQWRIRPAWIRVRGRFLRGELRLARFPNGAQVIYRMRPDETLDATYELGGQISRATLRRVAVAVPSPMPSPTP